MVGARMGCGGTTSPLLAEDRLSTSGSLDREADEPHIARLLADLGYRPASGCLAPSLSRHRATQGLPVFTIRSHFFASD